MGYGSNSCSNIVFKVIKAVMISKENYYRCDPEDTENRKPRRNKPLELEARMNLVLARRIWF